MHNEETNRSWVQPVLARHLGPVEAPAGLWERIAEPRMPRPAISNLRLIPAFAAVLLAAVLLWGFHPGANPGIEFRSGEPGRIQSWVKANTGLDVRLDVPPHASGTTRLMGASVVPGAAPSARIIYRVGAKDVALMVAAAGGVPALAGDASFSWIAGGQRYTVSSSDAEELRVGCLQCHAGA